MVQTLGSDDRHSTRYGDRDKIKNYKFTWME